MIIIVSYQVYFTCVILYNITELKYFYIKSTTMFKFLVAKLGYQVQIPGSPSIFLVAYGYGATTKSYTDWVQASGLTLKLIGSSVIRSSKLRVPVAPQNVIGRSSVRCPPGAYNFFPSTSWFASCLERHLYFQNQNVLQNRSVWTRGHLGFWHIIS